MQQSTTVTKWLAVWLTRIIATWENLSYVWQMYDSPVSSRSIFCKMNVATYNQKPQKNSSNYKNSRHVQSSPLMADHFFGPTGQSIHSLISLHNSNSHYKLSQLPIIISSLQQLSSVSKVAVTERFSSIYKYFKAQGKSFNSCKLTWTMCANWKLLQCASKTKSLEFTSLTVFESSLPDSMILKHKGIISVVRRKFITSASSVCKATRHLSVCYSREVNNE